MLTCVVDYGKAATLFLILLNYPIWYFNPFPHTDASAADNYALKCICMWDRITLSQIKQICSRKPFNASRKRMSNIINEYLCNKVENVVVKEEIANNATTFSKVVCRGVRKHLYAGKSEVYMSRSARKRTIWPLHNVSTQISLRISRRLIRADTFRLRGIEV